MNLKLNSLFLVALLAVSVFISACGGDSKHSGQSIKYPAGSVTNEDIKNQLEFDARVQDYDDSDDKKLVINVHQSWVASPPGLPRAAKLMVFMATSCPTARLFLNAPPRAATSLSNKRSPTIRDRKADARQPLKILNNQDQI